MLTSKEIKNLKSKDKRYQITDQDGLALRIQKSGVKSWVLRVPQNGRIVDITLGHWPEYQRDDVWVERAKYRMLQND